MISDSAIAGLISALVGGGFVAATFRFASGRNKQTDAQQALLYDQQSRRIEELEAARKQCEQDVRDFQREISNLQSEVAVLRTKVAYIDPGGVANIVCDSAGIISEWNETATIMFGYSRAEAIGQNVSMIVPHRLRADHDRSFEKAASEKRGPSPDAAARMRESYGLKRDGSELPVTITLRGWQHAGQQLYSAEIRRR